MSRAIVDVTEVLDRQKITRFNVGLVILAFLVMMTDGYDLGAAAFAGPGLIKEWGLRGPELGVLLSSSLAAGFFGPPILGYIADHFGRKRVIVAGAFAFGLFSLAAVATTSLNQLVLTRIFAGIALAGTLPTVVSLINEFAPKHARATMVILMFSGVTFGGGLPGLIAAKFMAVHGWRILFWVGGLAPLAIVSVLVFALPESVKYLTLHPARRDELVALLKRIDGALQI
ncbi:MAG: MFS transporter, partial [Xanthobacteraceae bacterium]